MKQVIFLIALLCSFTSKATLIEFELNKTSYEENDVITAQLIASDFSEVLGGFSWADISFDASKLQLAGFTFGDAFDDGFGSLQTADDSIVGHLTLSDFSFIFAEEAILAAKQGTRFVLASFEFNSLALGEHTISLMPGTEVVNFANTMVEVIDTTQVSFTVGSTPVPTPVTLSLFMTGLILLRKKLV